MPMPKGYTSQFGYATVSSDDGCLTYREIADVLTQSGDKCNHSTARNIFLRAMRKIADKVAAEYDGVDPLLIAEDPRFQEAIQQFAAETFDI